MSYKQVILYIIDTAIRNDNHVLQAVSSKGGGGGGGGGGWMAVRGLKPIIQYKFANYLETQVFSRCF